MHVSILSLSFSVKFICEYFRKRDLSEVTLPNLLVVGDVTNWYQRKRCLLSDIAQPVGGQGHYKYNLVI